MRAELDGCGFCGPGTTEIQFAAACVPCSFCRPRSQRSELRFRPGGHAFPSPTSPLSRVRAVCKFRSEPGSSTGRVSCLLCQLADGAEQSSTLERQRCQGRARQCTRCQRVARARAPICGDRTQEWDFTSARGQYDSKRDAAFASGGDRDFAKDPKPVQPSASWTAITIEKRTELPLPHA